MKKIISFWHLKAELNFQQIVDQLRRVKEGCIAFARAKSLSVDVLVLPLDVTDHDNHKNHTQAEINHFHRIDILLNNSG